MKKLIIFFSVLFMTILYSQNINSIHNANCDRIFSEFNLNYGSIPIKELPKLTKSLDSFQNDFLDIIDTCEFNKSIYVKAFIDTNGTILCLDLIAGNNNKVDSIAMKYIIETKFNSAINVENRKIPTFVSIPLYGNNLKETHGLIKVNDRWHAIECNNK